MGVNKTMEWTEAVVELMILESTLHNIGGITT